jgi:hypothetical protein
MIDVKTAIEKAKVFMLDFFPEKAESVRLEEVALDKGESEWKITLSFKGDAPRQNPLRPFEYSQEHRVFKIIVINASSGEFIEMKIRELQSA